eukprot:7567155-Pyramimonas_sp.AAC.1
MSLKAAEAATMLSFAVAVLNQYGGAPTFGEALIGVGGSLMAFISELKRHPIMPDETGMQRLINSFDALT